MVHSSHLIAQTCIQAPLSIPPAIKTGPPNLISHQNPLVGPLFQPHSLLLSFAKCSLIALFEVVHLRPPLVNMVVCSLAQSFPLPFLLAEDHSFLFAGFHTLAVSVLPDPTLCYKGIPRPPHHSQRDLLRM